jgi:hypothetical protein
MTKWFVTVDKYSSYIDDPDAPVWTVSKDPNNVGWETDSGHCGYGLPKKDAEELANAANRIEQLEAALREIIERAEHRMSHSVSDDTCLIARKALKKTNASEEHI